jgi:hypothetical protein
MSSIPLDRALRLARVRAARGSYELVLPGDPRREAALHGLAAAHALTGSGWSLDHAREHVSLALPGVGDGALALLSRVPYVGLLLTQVVGSVVRPQIYLAPSALRDGAALLGVLLHEEGHVGQIRAGGPLWCLAYGVVGELRAGAESPCYAADITIRTRLGGESPRRLYDGALESLRAYGLAAGDLALAESIIRAALVSLDAGADPGGLAAEVREDLRRLDAPTVDPLEALAEVLLGDRRARRGIESPDSYGAIDESEREDLRRDVRAVLAAARELGL